MDEHPLYAKCVSYQASVLAAGSAEAVERVFGDVVATLDGNLFNRFGHVLDRDHQESLCGLDRRTRIASLLFDLGGKRSELIVHDHLVQGFVAVCAEDAWEELGADLSDHHVRVSDAQWPAPAVACRARVGTGRIRPDPVARTIEVEDRSTASRYRVDLHHRRTHTHTCD